MFVSSDLQAFGVLRAIREQGLDVPGDIALVTFDGTEESAFSWPSLTLAQQPPRRWRRQRSTRCWAQIMRPTTSSRWS
jgi:LacI family transcriptional regulator, galactose operon repressor